MSALLGDLDVASLRESYVRSARERLAAGGRLAAARDDWETFLTASHGDVFAMVDQTEFDPLLGTAESGSDGLDTSGRVFLDTLWFDFLVDCLLDAFEGRFEVSIRNRAPGTTTGIDGVAFGSLHDSVLPPARGRSVVRAAVGGADLADITPDALRALYRSVVPRQVRLALGEYYTPRGLAELALAEEDLAERLVLDPGCGSGVFLVAALRQKRRALDRLPPNEAVSRLTDSVVGIDLNPLSVKTATLSYCGALTDLLASPDVEEVTVPVYLTDALGLTREDDLRVGGEPLAESVDTLVGNPPWVPWERLSDVLKQRWREQYVERLGLQPHEGVSARLGHSNDDISVPFAWACIHRYLGEGGTATFVLKRDIMRGPAGVVLRRLSVGERPLSLRAVHDFAAVDPFPDASASAALYRFVADSEPTFPIPATVWTPADGHEPAYGSLAALRETLATRDTDLVALDPDDRTSAWIDAAAERAATGECAHDIRHGLKDDANAVFGLDRDQLDRLEPGLVYPYLKSRHVRKYGLTGHDLRLVPQRQAGVDNEARLRREYSRTYEYLHEHRKTLLERSSSWLDRGPFYSVFGLGPYTWADYRVAWCRLGFKPDFTVVTTREDPDLGEKHVVPGDHYMFVATDSRETAHFLCALLNSAPYQRTLADLASGGKASLSKSLVSNLWLPDGPATDEGHRLAAASMRAHEVVANHDDEQALEAALAPIQADIDRLAEGRLRRENRDGPDDP